MKRSLVTALVFLLAGTGLASAMRVSVPGDSRRTCFDTKSPAINLSNVPDGTASLRVRISNSSDWTDFPASVVIPYRGQKQIEAGAVRIFLRCGPPLRYGLARGFVRPSFGGPVLGFNSFDRGAGIEVKVTARDAKGRILATARDDAWYPVW